MRMHAKLGLYIFALFALHQGHVEAGVITWADWTYPSDQLSVATVSGLGSASLTPQGPSTKAVNAGIFQFDNANFSPTTLSTVGWVRGLNPNAVWGYTLDLSGLSSTEGVIVGFGNFGHISGDPQWRITAFDASNAPVALSTLTQLGSFDHTWVTNGGFQFNDDISLDTNTGLFSIATTPGVNDINSDMMLFSLHSGVSRIHVESVAPYLNDDTHNIVVGKEITTVPEPSALLLWCIGGATVPLFKIGRRNWDQSSKFQA